MSKTSFSFQFNEFGNTTGIMVRTRRIGVMTNNFTNRGTAFSKTDRQDFELEGMLPPTVRTLEQQIALSFKKLATKSTDVGKYIFLRSLFDRNVTLAHAVIKSDIEGLMKIIYTPTVGLACREYSSMFRTAQGLHFYPGNIDQAEKILGIFARRQIRVAVVTDNQGILGIGDQGAGGIAICLGKLMLYTQGAGIAPWHCLPISLDVGTDSETLLNDKNYLGWQHRRLNGDEYISFVKKFARAFKKVFPDAICQWEDFSKQKAFLIRDTFIDDLKSFNDDIQGTGAIALSAILTALKIKNEGLEDQRFLIYGSGAGGIGVAEQIETALIESGLSERHARDLIYILDRQGLVTEETSEQYKKKYAKSPHDLSWFRRPDDGSLINVIKNAGITVLIGTSGQPGHFTADIVRAIAMNTERPLIMPLSNPTEYSEAVPEDIMSWTSGKALIATGSPFGTFTFGKDCISTGQCNNVFIFPGIGLGVLASGISKILPEFFTAAAHAVSGCMTAEDRKKGMLMPSIDKLAAVSREVAFAVGLKAIEKNMSGDYAFGDFRHNNDEEQLKMLIDHMRWEPEYLPLIAI